MRGSAVRRKAVQLDGQTVLSSGWTMPLLLNRFIRAGLGLPCSAEEAVILRSVACRSTETERQVPGILLMERQWGGAEKSACERLPRGNPSSYFRFAWGPSASIVRGRELRVQAARRPALGQRHGGTGERDDLDERRADATGPASG